MWSLRPPRGLRPRRVRRRQQPRGLWPLGLRSPSAAPASAAAWRHPHRPRCGKCPQRPCTRSRAHQNPLLESRGREREPAAPSSREGQEGRAPLGSAWRPTALPAHAHLRPGEGRRGERRLSVNGNLFAELAGGPLGPLPIVLFSPGGWGSPSELERLPGLLPATPPPLLPPPTVPRPRCPPPHASRCPGPLELPARGAEQSEWRRCEGLRGRGTWPAAEAARGQEPGARSREPAQLRSGKR